MTFTIAPQTSLCVCINIIVSTHRLYYSTDRQIGRHSLMCMILFFSFPVSIGSRTLAMHLHFTKKIAIELLKSLTNSSYYRGVTI